ncbi:class I SAM-dependent methyltransferase [Paenibacillus aurantius]|uniref:Class I SAM-dependent methyltransferase n=1 Tax=Paenibacillus aurantius TaxID=2918900 RepID=A0AA96RFX2_9BACL|nr:class I SAM-dependent methyltransferase [Paenibacillus aurantius]WNQ11936.1 class I SAM-dependent methyltransferase [Paenibacillus aurantius]
MDSKERFSNRVDTYVLYRPSYPKEALDYLYGPVGFTPESEIADIGAGTGIFSRLLLERGSRVLAVEPNGAMREAAEKTLGDEPRYQSVAATAEETGLPDGAVDHITCAQSFHWFDRTAARKEFHRILKPGGKVALIWNSRLTGGTPFLEGYESLLHRYGTDYEKVGHKNLSEATLASFFKEHSMQRVVFPYRQLFDLEGLRGRLASSSYTPAPGQPNHEPMMMALDDLFNRTQQDGTVSFDYETEIYWGEV